ncbi:hypothetical protein OAX78_00350, partial [Planctomycetota bacterium]|nr:hypothetical protein [Planctomycetota bacterium]
MKRRFGLLWGCLVFAALGLGFSYLRPAQAQDEDQPPTDEPAPDEGTEPADEQSPDDMPPEEMPPEDMPLDDMPPEDMPPDDEPLPGLDDEPLPGLDDPLPGLDDPLPGLDDDLGDLPGLDDDLGDLPGLEEGLPEDAPVEIVEKPEFYVEVERNDGEVFTGRLRDRGDTVVIDTASGPVEIPKADINRMTQGGETTIPLPPLPPEGEL